MSGIVQDLVVTLVAISAAVFVVRQVVSAFRPDGASPACDHCEPAATADRQTPR